jgi:hypothetical protein
VKADLTKRAALEPALNKVESELGSRRPLGPIGGDRWNRRLPGLAGFRLRYRGYDPCRWRLCHPVTGFPVEIGGGGELHAAFLTESRTRSRW